MKASTLKRGLSLILAAGMAASLAACGSSSSSSTSTTTSSDTAVTTAAAETSEGDTAEAAASYTAPEVDASRTSTANSDEKYPKITYALPSDPSDIGPTGYGDNSAQYVLMNFYETLFDFRDNEYIPILAKGYTEVDDTHWDVELWDNIHDSEGNPITADDVVFSYNLLIDSGKAAKFDAFESIEALDDYTVEFTWNKKIDSVGECEWTLCRCYIVSQAAYEGNGNTMSSKPIGTGPYTLKEYVPGAKIVMEANDNYWQDAENTDPEHLANVQELEYDIISEASQHVIALSTDTVQYSESVPTENIADFEEGGQYAAGHEVYQTMGSNLYVLFPNCTNEFLSDVNFRKACFYALSNDAIATAVGTLSPAKAFGTSFFSDYYSSWESADGNYIATYDPELAKTYLDQSSYNGETLTLLCSSGDVEKTSATMVQTLLLQIGVNVEINAEDGNLVDTDMRDGSKWDFLIKDIGGGSQIGEYNRPMNYNEFGTDLNLAMLHDDTLQEKLLNCATLEGHTEENMTDLHQYVLDNAYYYAIGAPLMQAVYSDVFASLVYREHEFLRPGACDYYLD